MPALWTPFVFPCRYIAGLLIGSEQSSVKVFGRNLSQGLALFNWEVAGGALVPCTALCVAVSGFSAPAITEGQQCVQLCCHGLSGPRNEHSAAASVTHLLGM
jgi:hypothetical protein